MASHAVGECAPTLLTIADIIELVLTSEAGLISAGAVLALTGTIAWRVARRPRGAPWGVVTKHLDVYLISLLGADAVQAMGGFLNLRWVNQQRVTCGHYCTAQGAIQTLGEPAVAMATLAIAIHTFSVFVFDWKPPEGFLLPILVVTFIWLFLSIYVGVAYAFHHNAATNDTLFAPSPDWCWIPNRFTKEKISVEYFWLWSACLVSLVLYIPLFFYIRGNIVNVNGRPHWRAAPLHGAPHIARQSRKMLLYPATYIVIVLPLTVSRWIEFHHPNLVPTHLTLAFDVLFRLSGVTNVLLLTLRPGLLGFGGVEPARGAPRAAPLAALPGEEIEMDQGVAPRNAAYRAAI